MSGGDDFRVGIYANPIMLSDDELDGGSYPNDESFTSVEREMLMVLKVSSPHNDDEVIR